MTKAGAHLMVEFNGNYEIRHMIRRSRQEDIQGIMRIFEEGKQKMRESGNLSQWSGGYPSAGAVLDDIGMGNSYVVEKEGRIIATFAFILGEDPTYKRIEDGKWLNDEPYGTIHRIASEKGTKGILPMVLDWAFGKVDNVRIDTHADNAPMLHILEREGFAYCGIIFVADGTPRKAFQKCKKSEAPGDRTLLQCTGGRTLLQGLKGHGVRNWGSKG